VTVSSGTDRVAEQIGFRSIEVRGTDILLNGRPVFLRGVSIHEEDPLRGGRAGSEEEARMLLTWAKELNCNFVRLAHYPHSEYMARIADQMGIMVWEEIPVYWTILWDNLATLENAQNQLTELIERDKNRASVIVWSVANETPISAVRNQFLETLIGLARSLDDTRLVSAAMEVHGTTSDSDVRVVDDPLGEFTDMVSFNEYVGWYDGLPDKCGRIKWSIKYQKPVVISEFGGGALQGFHADRLTRFSEEYQEDLYRQTLPMLQKIPQFRGVTPWILCDFRSPRRLLPNIQDGWNRKGLIGENGIKKKAFDVLKAFYDQMEKQSDQ
jgi:beta-glucuronidase